MLRRWVASGAVKYRRARPDSMSLPVLSGHAGLNLIGLSFFIGFVLSGAVAAAWVALVCMIPAIGLGVSTVSVWTPYPVRRAAPEDRRGPADPLAASEREWRHSAIPDQVLSRALQDEATARKVTEDLLARNLAYEARQDRRPQLDIRAIIPFAHGALAISTFVLVTLSAIAAS
jgi:hypothetical protein